MESRLFKCGCFITNITDIVVGLPALCMTSLETSLVPAESSGSLPAPLASALQDRHFDSVWVNPLSIIEIPTHGLEMIQEVTESSCS